VLRFKKVVYTDISQIKINKLNALIWAKVE